MASTYQDLIAQRDALELKIAEAKAKEVTEILATVRKMVADYDLTVEDVFKTSRSQSDKKTNRSTVAPKYRDPTTGATWTGRGKAPKWIEGQDRELYLIDLPANDKAADN